MLPSKAPQINVHELAKSVVESYRDHLRQNKDQLLLKSEKDDESTIELVCKVESPRHMSRREVESLKSWIHRLLPMCGHVWVNQGNKKKDVWPAEVVVDFDPAVVHRVLQ